MAYVFVSYSRRDKQELEKLVSTLETAGHGVWWDVQSIQGGEDWQAAISRAIVDSDVTILILSPHAVNSEWVQRELAISWDNHKPVIPFQVAPVEQIPDLIKKGNINIVIAYNAHDAALSKLLADLGGVARAGRRIPFAARYARLSNFLGRSDDFRRIHALLQTPRGPGAARVGLHGMGGIGKTQLCIEYAHRYRYYFPDGVFFVDAGADLGHQFASLAPVIDPSGESFPLRSKSRRALRRSGSKSLGAAARTSHPR